MGGVLLDYDPVKALRRHGVSEEDIDLINREFYGRRSIAATDAGLKTHKQVILEAADRLNDRCVRVLKEMYLDQSYGIVEMPEIPQMYGFISRLRDKGYGIYLLSNAGYDFYEYTRPKKVFELIPNIFISANYHVVKPDPAIYRLFFKEFGLDPSECVFVDDMQANVDGSIACGMDAICFASAREPLERLEKEFAARGIEL